nr:serine carboxypeptidase-like 13 [Ipomoea batatas]
MCCCCYYCLWLQRFQIQKRLKLCLVSQENYHSNSKLVTLVWENLNKFNCFTTSLNLRGAQKTIRSFYGSLEAQVALLSLVSSMRLVLSQINYANTTTGDIPALELNPYAWTKVANIIFLDQPVGTGFSYSKTWEASISTDTLSAQQTYSFLIQWLLDHPKFLSNPLYITGDSYSGIIIPLIVRKIYDGLESGIEPRLNMKGYVVGNPMTADTYANENNQVIFAYRMGLLSHNLYQVCPFDDLIIEYYNFGI